MRFDGIALRNFRCYAETSVSFEPGVTVVHGQNGSGKSSLLDACFFALYGAQTLDGSTLEDVITTGTDESRIELQFTHDGSTHELVRELADRGDRAQTTTCQLEMDDDTITGARAVRDAIARMLRMDVEAFLNCAYVRQGEVNKLIHASPRERQDMIDELLQLGVLEAYRDRAIAARREVASVRDEIAGQVTGLAEQIERKEETDLHALRSELESERLTHEEEIADLDERIEVAEERRETAVEVIENTEERRIELEAVEADIATIREAIETSEGERAEIADRIASLSDDRESLDGRIESLHAELGIDSATRDAVEDALEANREREEALRERRQETRVEQERTRESLEQATERVEEYASRADALEKEAEERANAIEKEATSLDDRRGDVQELREARADAQAALSEAGITRSDVPAEIDRLENELGTLRERESEIGARIEALEEGIEEMDALVAAGKCPTCGQDVADAPHVDSLADDRDLLAERETALADVAEARVAVEEELASLRTLEAHVDQIDRLDDRIETAQALIAEKESSLEDRRATLDTLEEDAAEARSQAAEAEKRAAEARETLTVAAERLETVNERLSALSETADRLEDAFAAHDRRTDLADEIATLQERITGIDELNDERRDRIREKRERRRALAEAVDADRVEAARESIERADEFLEAARERRATLAAERDDVLDRIGRVQAELEALEDLRERHDELAARAEVVQSLHEEVDALASLYGRLRSDLRERNVAALERMLNETFELVYQNDAYDRIDLDGEYRFTVFQKDGEPLSPELLSGGERALFNLSLRCAIYRLLAEGIDATTPLPPLILDEPTVYLDEGHVSRLVDLIDAMREIGVEQIIVVTHDRELLRAADVILTVEKNPTSNRSSVEARPAGGPVLAHE